jgi:predicted nucleic acid-binding protein
MGRQRKMSRKVFVDTSAWIALINGDDTLHERSIEIIKQLYTILIQ